ncbi:MAG: penicillin-binding protein 1C [Vicinamibacterales bacterium]
MKRLLTYLRAHSQLPAACLRLPARTRARPAFLLTIAAAGIFALWARLGPLPAGLLEERGTSSTVVLDRNGVPLYEARSIDGTRRVKLTPANLPQQLVDATIAAEDRRFWRHVGIDPVAIVRAARINLAERSVVEGGSTITQQVAKLLLNRRSPGRPRGWSAKAHEALIALRLEHRFSKREIVAMYLNLAAYGNQVVGAERAARAYFSTSASMLTVAQAAFISGLPQRPSGFNPYRSRDAAMSRQRVVIRRMESTGAVTADQAGEAREERLAFASASDAPFGAPHFVEMVLAGEGTERPERIVTTLDSSLQVEIAGVIESHRAVLRRHGAANVAVVVLDNATGEWLAWEGSGNYGDAQGGGTINGAIAPRQPGSALKPFTYALGFEQGFRPSTVLADIPSTFPTGEDGVVYSPRNYDGRFRGPLLARAALAGSENVPAVALAAQLGVPKLLRFLGRAGLTTFDRTSAHYGLGLTLGNAEVRLDELVAAYAMFARGGEFIAPVSIVGKKGQTRRVVSQRTAFWITDILSDPEAREYTFGRGGSLEFPFPVAVKTGTSQAYHDNWTVGYSRHVTAGVWVGNFDRTPLRNSSGVTGAAPIFQGVMLAAERRGITPGAASSTGGILPPSADTLQHEICTVSGAAANPWCPTRRREWQPAGQPLPACNWHHLANEELVTILPAEYDAWTSSHRPSAVRTSATPTIATSVIGRSTIGIGTSAIGASDVILSPADGGTYLIDPTLRREFQTLSLKAAAASGRVEWSINGRPLGASMPRAQLEWPLVPGRHTISARDAGGHTDEVTVVVR